MAAINPNKIIDILLFDEIKAVPYDKKYPLDLPVDYERPKIVFVMDIDARFQDNRRYIYFDTLEQAESTYLSLVKQLNFINL